MGLVLDMHFEGKYQKENNEIKYNDNNVIKTELIRLLGK